MKTHHNLYLLVSLLLLLLFAAGSFSLLSTEIFAYRRLNETIQSQEDISLPLAYVHTKLKHASARGQIAYVTKPITCLQIKEKETVTYLYYQDGYIKEITAVSSYQPTFEEGTKLFQVDAFTIIEKQDCLLFTVEKDGKKEQLSIYLYGKAG